MNSNTVWSKQVDYSFPYPYKWLLEVLQLQKTHSSSNNCNRWKSIAVEWMSIFFFSFSRTLAELSLGIFNTVHNRCWSSEHTPGTASTSLLKLNCWCFAGGARVHVLFSPLPPPCSGATNPPLPALFAQHLCSSHHTLPACSDSSTWLSNCLIPVCYTHLWWT